MVTNFGKELRKLRIDKGENINTMAKKLGISISYLSAIETGNRKIPDGLANKIIEKYHLNKEKSSVIIQAEIDSSKGIDIDLSNLSCQQRQLVFALSRKLTDISDKECLDIIRKLK